MAINFARIFAVFLLIASPAFAGGINNGGNPNVSQATGTLPVANGGTNATTAATALVNLGLTRITVSTYAGIHQNTKQVTSNVSITSGNSTLTCTSCAFASGDVGKNIVIGHAGIVGTTGSVNTVAITSGGTYASTQPSISFAASGGSGAVAIANLTLASATPASAGTGYTNGTQTLSLNASGCTTAPQINVTVSGNVVTAVNSITNAGSCWNIASTGGATVTAPGTQAGGTGATFTVTWTIGSITVISGGTGYPLTGGAVTASASGGSPSVAPVIGATTVLAPVAPLATTIATYISGTQVTLNATAGNTLSSSSQLVTWGNDDAPAIQNAVATACATNQVLYFAGSGYGLAANDINIPSGCNFEVYGDGAQVSVIYALASIPVNANYPSGATQFNDMISKFNNNGNTSIHDLGLYGNQLISAPLNIYGAHGGYIHDIYVNDVSEGGQANIVVGNPVYNYLNGLFFANINTNNYYAVSNSEEPLYNVYANSPDNSFGNDIQGLNASIANVYDDGNFWVASHFWGAAPAQPQYNYYIVGQARLLSPYADSASVAGYYDANSGGNSLVNPRCYWNPEPSPSTYCVELASGVAYVGVVDPVINNSGFPAANAVYQAGTVSTNNRIDPARGTVGQPTSYQSYMNLVNADPGYQINGVNGLFYPSGDTTQYGSIGIGKGTLGYEDAAGSVAYENTAVGYQSMQNNTMTNSAINNSMFGNQAGYQITTGSNNACFGYHTCKAAYTANKNASFGGQSFLSNQSGVYNTIMGYYADSTSTSGNGNTIIGAQSSSPAMVTGDHNTLLGYNVGQGNLNGGGNNILVGIGSSGAGGADVVSATDNNKIVIGNLWYGSTVSSTTAPTVSACGTNSIDTHANNATGQVNITAGTPTSCTITFAGTTPYATWNHCVVTSESVNASFAYSYTTSAITLTGTALAGKFDYQCQGY